jgi:hypothetical protein
MSETKELERDYSKADPYKVFKVIGEIIADREGIKVTLKSVKKKDEQKTA